MPTRTQKREIAPSEIIDGLNLGYNGYTSPNLTVPKMWIQASNVFSAQAGWIQRCRFANVVSFSPATSLAYQTLKYFALPGLSTYLLGDLNGKLYSYDSGSSYTQTQRLNPYVDPTGTGSSSLNGPWSREFLNNIIYEMNGTVKQSGRGANAATVEGWGLDAPDTSPGIQLSAGGAVNISAIARSAGIVSITTAAPHSIIAGTLFNVVGVADQNFNGSFVALTVPDGTHVTYAQSGIDTSSSGGQTTNQITKSIGRSYAWAWENANKPHVSAPSPSTQYIQYSSQFANIPLIEVGSISTSAGSATVTGTSTAFTSAWVGRSLWAATVGSLGRILSVQSATSLTLATAAAGSIATQSFQVYDPQSTHVRIYATGDGGATYFRIGRNAFNPAGTTVAASGLNFTDTANAEPPNFPFTTETSQLFNLPPPVGSFVNEYQGRLCVFGVSGASQSFFYSNMESTSIGMPQESFAPLNQVTLPIQNASVNGMLEFPGSMIVWSDKQDMFRLTGLLSDNTASTAPQLGATITRLPYNLGSASPYAMDITPLGGIWLTSNAEIWLYTDRYAPRNIGRPVQDILNSITPANLSLCRAKYFHTNLRNWFAIAVPANGSTFNNKVLVLDIDLLASNGSPSYFTFDMATNSPSWYVFDVRSDSLEVVYERLGIVRLMAGGIDLIEDIDFQQGFGTEIAVTAKFRTHPWGNDSATMIKKPSYLRFTTNQRPAMLATQGWTFAAYGIDDDFYTFDNPISLTLTPGTNDTSALCGNPGLVGGESFRHSPGLFRIGGVNFVQGRRIEFEVSFPSGTGINYQFRSVQIAFGPRPPS